MRSKPLSLLLVSLAVYTLALAAQPVANLVLDDEGNLYGTTGGLGFGVAFELTP